MRQIRYSQLSSVPDVLAFVLGFLYSEGNPFDHTGLRLHLSDFTHQELAQDKVGGEEVEMRNSRIQLCQCLAAAESKVRQVQLMDKHFFAPEVKKRKRSETPPKETKSDD